MKVVRKLCFLVELCLRMICSRHLCGSFTLPTRKGFSNSTPPTPNAMPQQRPNLERSWFIVHNSYILNNAVQALHKRLMCWVLFQVISPIFIVREMAYEAM